MNELSVEKRKRNQRGEGAQLKVEIIEAAMRLLDYEPGAQLSLRTVAREAGIAAPSIYAHFPDARAMTTEIVRECWVQMAQEMEEAANSADQARGGFEELKAKMGAFVRYAMERPSRYQLLFALYPIDTAETLELPALLQPAFRSVRGSIEKIAAGGGRLPAKNTMSATLLALSLAHGRIALAHLAPLEPGNSPAGVVAFVLETLHHIFFSSS
jgi:AcrR family transcriptional regulator